jgi:hypothetical protein
MTKLEFVSAPTTAGDNVVALSLCHGFAIVGWFYLL